MVFLTSTVMDDSPNGGGLPSNVFVVSGASNLVFDDVTSLQKASGGVSLRSIWATVNTETSEKLTASYIAITKPPSNPNVSLFAFEVDKNVSYRSDAENKITAYLSPGIKMAGHLLEKHLAGQQTIQISLNKKDTLPKVGDSIVLIQNEGQSDEFKQFLHVSDVTSKTRQFEISANNTVERIIATLEISQALDYEFNGITVAEFYGNANTSRRCIVRETNVASANKIYSGSKLATAIVANTTNQLQVESIFTQVVPSASSPEPLSNMTPALQQKNLILAGGDVLIDKTIPVVAGQTWFIGSGIYPSSLELTINGVKYKDEKYTLINANNEQIANVDNGTGSITWLSNVNLGNVRIIGKYKPAGKITEFGDTHPIQVPKTGATKVFTTRLKRVPSRLSVTVSYQYNGNIYILKDDGNGNLYSPTSNGGTGRVEYDARDIQITTSVIPDAESIIIITFATETDVFQYNGNTIDPASILIPIPDKSIINNTLSINIGNQRITGTSAGGLTGDGTGFVINGFISVAPNTLPAKSTIANVTYQTGNVVTHMGRVSANAYQDTISGTGPIKPQTVNITTLLDGNIKIHVRDNGSGDLYIVYQDPIVGYDYVFNLFGSKIGTIDYTNRQITMNWHIYRTYTVDGVTKTDRFYFLDGADVEVNYMDSLTARNVSLAHTIESLSLRMPNNTGGSKIIDGSVEFHLNHLKYRDSGGILKHTYQDDGTSQQAGIINYVGGIATVTDWSTGANSVTVNRITTKENQPPITEITFRTPLSPILQGQMFLEAYTEDNQRLELTVDNNSKFSGSNLAHGKFYYNDGVAVLKFYEKLQDNATTQAEPWYSSSLVYSEGGVNYVNKPIYVKPESVVYTATATKFTPLDKSVIGVDPARLPLDGRIPFIQRGDYTLITEDLTYPLASPAPNKSYDTGIVRQTDITIMDGSGKELALTDINANLDAGTFELTNSFLTSNYTLPLTATIRISDLGVATNVDISGRITINQNISHNYTANAFVSSVLVNNGNQGLQVKAYNFFTQKSWDNVFADTPRNTRANIQYNDSAFPPIVSNRSTPTDRLAFVFKSATTVDVIAEELGTLATNVSITQDVVVMNPVTGHPMIKLFAQGWSGGGEINNVLRLNLQSVNKQIWLGSAIQPHNGNNSDVYDYQIEHLADTDRVRAS